MSRPTLLLLLITSAACAMLAWPPPALAQTVHRCADALGASVFTDRRCEDLGAASRVIRPQLNARGQPAVPENLGCPRRLSELVQRISAAIHAGDANRLAWLYQWNGISEAGANRLMDQMEAIVRRPLLDIAPVFPVQAPLPVLDARGNVVDANADGYYPQLAPQQRQRPVGLRLQQTLANTATPSSTVLGLRRSDGCFWIRL